MVEHYNCNYRDLFVRKIQLYIIYLTRYISKAYCYINYTEAQCLKK